MSKKVYTCIGLEIGLGHFLYVVSWIDNIFLPKNVQSGKSVYLIWNWIGFPLDDWIWWRWYDGEPTYWDISGHTYVQNFWRCYTHVLDLELDWVISEVMQMLEYGTSMHMLEYCTSMYCHILVTFRKLKYLDLCSNTYHQRGWVWGFGLIQYTILDLTMGKFRAQGVHQTGQQSTADYKRSCDKDAL